MSWLFKTLSSADDPAEAASHPAPESEAATPVGVKEDLSAIGLTIGRQFRSVAAFLAPPPTTASKIADDPPPESESKSEALLGLRSDLAEIGGSLKSGLTILSSNGNRAVGEISKFASSFMPFQSKPEDREDDLDEDDEEEEDDVYLPGITDDVLQFVTQISMRPECWTDFPLQFDHGFNMSDAQREHASTVEQYIPDFAALKQRLCNCMNEEVFWMIYFILLVPRLRERDSELLSTPEIVKARDVLLQKLHDRETEPEIIENSGLIHVRKTEGQDIPSLEQELSKIEVSDKDKVDTEQSLNDKPIDDSGNSSAADVRFETEDDVSFSDLEDDDSLVSRRLSVNKKVLNESNDWVQLRESPEGQSSQRKKDSEGEDSSDWLNVDDFD